MDITWGEAMKLKNIILWVCIVVMFSTTFSGCIPRRYYVSHPSDQTNTFWSTEDGKVYFYVDDTASSPIYGYIETSEGPIEIAIYMSSLTSVIEVAYADDARNSKEGEPIPSFAIWSYSEYDDSSMVVTVAETKYLDVGQELVFYRK